MAQARSLTRQEHSYDLYNVLLNKSHNSSLSYLYNWVHNLLDIFCSFASDQNTVQPFICHKRFNKNVALTVWELQPSHTQSFIFRGSKLN